MGHKLAAAEYWEIGAIEHMKKKDKYIARYQAYQSPGYLGGFKNATAKKFMYDPANYAFQWGPLNQSDGSRPAPGEKNICFITTRPGDHWKTKG